MIDPNGKQTAPPAIQGIGDDIVQGFHNTMGEIGRAFESGWNNLKARANRFELKGGLVLMGNKAGISEPRKYKSGDDIDYIDGGVIEGLADAYGPSIDNKIMEGAKILSDVLQKVFTPLQNKGTSNTTENTSDDMIKMKKDNKVKLRITNVTRVVEKFGNNGRRVNTIEKDTMVNPEDAQRVLDVKSQKLEKAQKGN